MPANTSNRTPEDEIDLRELFATIWRYKRFIFLFTFLVTLVVVLIVYRMPKYYQTTTLIEVKPRPGDKVGSPSLGNLGTLAGLVGINVGTTNSSDKDAAKLALFRTNRPVIESVRYNAQFFAYDAFRYVELGDDNCSISISGLQIHDYHKFGAAVSFKPVSQDTFTLTLGSMIPFMSQVLGPFHYDTPIHTKDFDLAVHRNPHGVTPSKIILNGDEHYIFNNIITKNLTAEVGTGDKNAKVELPFVHIRYLDTLPARGEAYVAKLLTTYIHQSIKDELEDINISLSSVQKQIDDIEHKEARNRKRYQSFKTSNTLLSPQAQAEALIKSKAVLDESIQSVKRKVVLAKKLSRLSKNPKNLKTLIPLLTDLGDGITAGLVNQLQGLKEKESLLLQDYTPLHPSVVKLHKQMTSLRSRIRTNIRALSKVLTQKLTLLKKDQQRYIKTFKKSTRLETDLQTTLRDYKLFEATYTFLLQKRSGFELKKAEALSRFRVIDPIYTNPKPAKPKKALIAIVGLIAAFILAIFIVFFREFLRGEDAKQ